MHVDRVSRDRHASGLAAGTIVVDDSFPNCFDSDLAIHRMTSQKDVLLVDGGLYLKKGTNKPDTIYIIRNQYGIPAKVNVGSRADVTMVK